MSIHHLRTCLIPLPLALVTSCTTDSANGPSSPKGIVAPVVHSASWSSWSEPRNPGAPLNSIFQEQAPALSPDGLSLYFGSNRTDLPGGQGGLDIWVSRRACLDCDWETPVNLGATINTGAVESGPSLSIDGHLLFFQSNRPGMGSNDIWMAWRANPKDDLGWRLPVLLGSGVNTAAAEAGPEYLASAEEGPASLYFNRGPTVALQDLFYAAITRDGETLGPAVPVAELSDPAANDAAPAIRKDGREIIFHSNRPGVGLNDLWTSTRPSVHHPWAAPINVVEVNTAAAEQQPSLSSDARTLFFVSDRTGGLGATDIWVSIRLPRMP